MRQLTLPTFLPRSAAKKGSAKASHRRSSQRAANNRRALRKQRAPRWLLRLLRPAIMGAVALIVLSGGAVAWRTGGLDDLGAAVLAWTGSAGVAVRDVLVAGRLETPTTQILAALDVRKGSPLLAFSPAAARERLLALGWVRDARVERRFPNLIYVHLEERIPAAIWQNAGRLKLVDETGAVIGEEAVPRFSSLRVIVGPDAPEQFAALFTALETRPEMLEHVTAALRVGGRRWNLRLANGMTVLLPEQDIATAWRVLADAVRDSALLERDLVHIDLRIPGRLVLRLTPAAAQGRGADRGA
jgi:cell division protein FtsQ